MCYIAADGPFLEKSELESNPPFVLPSGFNFGATLVSIVTRR
jgi:hypothetical protein